MMERDPADNQVTFVEFLDQDDIAMETIEDAHKLILMLADCALALHDDYGYVMYPVYKVEHEGSA